MNIEEKANAVWEQIELCEHRDEEIALIVEMLDQHEQETRQSIKSKLGKIVEKHDLALIYYSDVVKAIDAK